jgi:hypothetical protein
MVYFLRDGFEIREGPITSLSRERIIPICISTMKRYSGSLTGVSAIGSIDQMPSPCSSRNLSITSGGARTWHRSQKLIVFRKSALLRIANPYMPKEDTCIEARPETLTMGLATIEWRCRKQSAPVEPRHEYVAKVAPPGTLQLPQAREWGSQICRSSSGNSRQHLFRSAVPLLMAGTNLGMSERNDTMAAHRVS